MLRRIFRPRVPRVAANARLPRMKEPPDQLTARESQILQLVAEGKPTKKIADILGISIKTVEAHRTRIMRKLQIHDIPGLVRYAIRRGLIQL